MSFILDALRKSESERRRDAAPGLAQIPMAAPRSGLPGWAWGVIAALGLSVLALSLAWWRSTADDPSAVAGPAVNAVAPSSDTAPAAAAVPDSAPSQPSVSAPLAADTAGTPADATGRTLPTLAEVVAAGMALPTLELQLLSYSENSAERFVFINGFQYRQGQRVQNGPLILSIYPEGVVLRHGGRDFVLLPE